MKNSCFSFACCCVTCRGVRAAVIVWMSLVATVTVQASAFENILHNPELRRDKSGYAFDWNFTYEGLEDSLRFGDEDGIGTATLLPSKLSTCGVRQVDIRLKCGGKYKIGALVRTKNCTCTQGGIIIYNRAWVKSEGVRPFPRDTDGKWVRLEKEITAPESRGGMYVFTVYASNLTEGEISFREPYLIALDAESDAEVVRPPKLSELRAITPITPLLGKLPEGDATVTFSFLDEIEKDVCKVALKTEGDGDFCEIGSFPIIGGLIKAKLPDLKPGRGSIRVAVCDKSGVEVAANEYPVRVLARAETPPEGRRLNELVTRILTAESKDGEFRFQAPRDGWIWISLERGNEGTTVTLDDGTEPVIIHRENERYETMRHVKSGEHVLSVKGATGGSLVVNSIPMIAGFTVPIRFFKDYYEVFGGKFCRERIFPVINTFSIGYPLRVIGEDELADLKSRGKELLGQICPWNPKQHPECDGTRTEPADHLTKRMRNSNGMTSPEMSGTTFDEIYADDVLPKLVFSEVLRNLATAQRPVYIWSAGYTYAFNALNREFLSAVANACDGNGKLNFECYPWTKPTEAEAVAHIEEMLVDSMIRANRLMPGYVNSSCYHLGAYSLPGRMSYDHYFYADYRWLVDRYWRTLATNPLFRGLAGIGLYAYIYASEEDVRWLLATIRHYAIEGRTDSLADRYGFGYILPHLKNADFASGLDGWRVSEGEPGCVIACQRKNFARGVLRYHDSKGESTCVLKRSAKEANTIAREIENLVPGRLYTLRYAVHNTNGVFDVAVTLSGATDVTATTEVAANGQTSVVTKDLDVRTLVFRAEHEKATFSLTDWLDEKVPKRGIGEETLFGAIRVRPYYE